MTIALRRAALALLGLLVLVAGTATAPATAVQPGYGTIAGVVRGPDGTPAAGVRVLAMEEGTGPDYLGAEGTTDAAGRYRIEALAGGYDLRTNDARGRFAKADVLGVDVRDGAVTTRDVALARGVTVSGRVVRADGGPIDGVQVQLAIPDPRSVFFTVTAVVAPDGTWTARGLHPGTWRGLVDPVAPTDTRYVVHDLAGRALQDRDGSPVAVSDDVTVPTVTLRHRTPVVRGTVRGVGGRPVAGVTVHTDDEDWWLDDGGSAPYPGIGDTTGGDGRYELRLDRAGRTYPLYVSTAATGYAVLPFRARVPGVDQAVTADVRLRSTARTDVEVRSRRGKQARVRVTYAPAVAGANRVAAVTVRYKTSSGTARKARKARGTLDRRGVLTVRLPRAKRGVRSIKVHVAGNADAVPVTRTVRARVR